ncbi:hypothetical protein, partial [Bacillus glycinifermentans]|uniref:hypothetical protein n=1 Tax=Bacillus glycinifermentans TaxID=1664069 RepID=UPI003D23AA10
LGEHIKNPGFFAVFRGRKISFRSRSRHIADEIAEHPDEQDRGDSLWRFPSPPLSSDLRLMRCRLTGFLRAENGAPCPRPMKRVRFVITTTKTNPKRSGHSLE